MKNDAAKSRRSFIKKLSATGMAAIGSTGFLHAGEQHIAASDDSKGATFLFQGDSITDGNRTRNNDWNHVMGHGYAYLIASRLWYDKPEKEFHFFNRGVSGNKVTDLAARWQTDTIDIKPNILSILVGINDVNSVINGQDVVDAAKYEEVYRNLLTETKSKLPRVQLVLMEPFMLAGSRVNEKLQIWQAEVKKRQAIVKRLAIDFDAIFIPLQDDFNTALSKAPIEYWIWDGIHPMPAGHELIARKWINIVKKKLPYIG